MSDRSPATPGAAALVDPLPHALPDEPNARLALFAIRRLGAHGLNDALAAHCFMTTFGEGFRRPLMLMRAFMHELAGAATHPITIAPCCCARATPSEAALVTVLARAATAPGSARLLLVDQLGTRAAEGVLACATALAAAFADAGRPIGRGAAAR
ncbi:MAG TPA: DUF6628 family protein [Sphingomonas sp.]|nr:DUF6628 family protein [Sphingomonas sp.]